MSAATDGPARVQVMELWTGGDADLLRQCLRMSNESFAEYLGVAVRTVANWRKQPGIIPGLWRRDHGAGRSGGLIGLTRMLNTAACCVPLTSLSTGQRQSEQVVGAAVDLYGSEG